MALLSKALPRTISRREKMSSPQIAQLIGSAGSGKTKELLDIMEKVVQQLHDPHLIGFSSFTRIAREVAATRAADIFNMPAKQLMENGWFRTCHSTAFKAIGARRDQILSGNTSDMKWLSETLQERLTTCDVDNDAEFVTPFADNATDAGKALMLWDLARNRMEPFRPVWEEIHAANDNTPQYSYCVRTIERYEESKLLDNRLDFTDMLALFAGYKFRLTGPDKTSPVGDSPDVPCWILDECVVGDTLVTLSDGTTMPIEQIVSGKVACEVMSMNTTTGMVEAKKVTGWHKSPTRGRDIVQIGNLRATKDHPVFTSFGDYLPAGLVKRYDRKVAVFRSCVKAVAWHWVSELPSNVTEVAESPDCVYCLSVEDNNNFFADGILVHNCQDSSKLIHECQMRLISNPKVRWVYMAADPFQCLAGETEVTFEDGRKMAIRDVVKNKIRGRVLSYNETTGEIEHNEISGWHESALGSRSMMQVGNLRCTDDHKIYAHTFGWVSSKDMKGKFSLRFDHYGAFWDVVGIDIPFSESSTKPSDRTVYCIDVENTHNFFADGILVHNCLFQFAGSDPDNFLTGFGPAAKRRIMPQSYRCPPPILELGEKILRGCSNYFDRKTAPAGHAGKISTCYLDSIREVVNPRDDWLLLARTNFQAARMGKLLDAADIPWSPIKGNSTWTAPVKNQAIQALMNIQSGAPIDGVEWKSILKNIKTKDEGGEILEHGVKAAFENCDDDMLREQFAWVLPEDLREKLGATEHFMQRVMSGEWVSWIKGAERYRSAVRKYGPDCILRPSSSNGRVRIGTVHSAKGDEAANVGVLTTISEPCVKNAQTVRGRNGELMCKYVAVTRSSRNLVIIREPNPRFSWGMPQ